MKKGLDPLSAEKIDSNDIPAEIASLADEIWHAVIDVLTDAGFNFPMGKTKTVRSMS